jgi:transposase
MGNEYWLDDEQWAAIEPLISTRPRGGRPGRNREVIRGVLHVLKFGRWCDCPGVYGPHTTIYNRGLHPAEGAGAAVTTGRLPT